MVCSTELIRQADKTTEKAWELFVSGDERALGKVRLEIRDSWQRAKAAGVSPKVQQFPTMLSPDELEKLSRKNVHFLDAGRETIALLAQTLTVESFIAGLVDKEGSLLYSYSPPGNDKRRDINAVPGARIGERLVGTDSSALAMYLDQPFLVYRHEHYAQCVHPWVGCAAPIHNPTGDILGALGLVGHQKMAHPRVLDLVIAAAASIERKVKQFEELSHFVVLEEFHRYLLRFSDSLLLALDSQGRILSLSPALAKLVTLQPPDRIVGQPLQRIRDLHCEGLRVPLEELPSEPYESPLVFPRREKTCMSTVIPVSREGHPAGLVIIASGLTRTVSQKVRKPAWQATHTFHALIGHSPAFSQALQAAEKAAAHDWPVLLFGESGTGKELIAHAIHQASHRAPGPFLALNCSTIPKDLAASELFGYEDGAFSGAARGGQQGKITLAHHGTLFLDEIVDMPAEIQAGLLRVLEEGKVVPLGSKQPRDADVRMIAALNIDPLTAVSQGKLRLDLYHRLNVFPVVLPPLRERQDDLPLLARHLLDREGFADVEVAPEVLDIFRTYSWPGNIRELRNVLVRAAVLAGGQVITLRHLPPELFLPHPSAPLLSVFATQGENGERSPSPSRPLDQDQIQYAFKACGGNITHAARRLGIHKATFYRKLQQYGLTRENLAASSSPAALSTY